MLDDRIKPNRKTLSAAQLEIFLLIGITILAAVLRFYKLGEWSLWGDEAFSLGSEDDGFNYSILRRSLAIDLIHFTTAKLGVSEWTGRLVPAVIGILSIPMLYFPLKRAFKTRVALLTCLLLSISTWHLYWSQNVRFYTLLLLFYTLGMLLFFIALEEDRPLVFLGSLVMFGLAARESLTALFFVPVLMAYLMLIKVLRFEAPPGLRWRNLLIFFGPMAVGGAFIAGPYLLNLEGWFSGFGRINNSPVWLFFSVVYYIALPTFLLGALGSLVLVDKKQRGALFMLVGGALPWLLLMGFSLFQYTANRYVFVTLICWLVLASQSIHTLGQDPRRRARILAIGLLILLLGFSAGEDWMYFNRNQGNRENWRGALEYVQAHKASNDLIVTANYDVSNHYLPGEKMTDFQHWAPEKTQKADRVWVIEDMNIPELMPEKHQWLLAHATEAQNFDIQVWARNYYLRVYYYDAPLTGGG